MSNQSPVNPGAPRLNPFIFPSDTDFRFILLIASVVSASLFAFHIIGNYLFQREFVEISSRCYVAAEAAYPGNPPIGSPEEYQKLRLLRTCWQPLNVKLSTTISGGVGLLLVVALILYWIAPDWKIWRYHLTPLSREDASELVAYLEELRHEVGLHPPPNFVWDPLNPGKSGQAFGRIGHYYVALPGGLVTLYYTDRPTFRAVMLHELSHLKNEDIDKTYFTVAVWQAFVVAASLPFIGLILYVILNNPELDEATLSLAGLVWRIFPLAALVYLMRNAVLRTREIYADLRASIWDNSSSALLRVLSTLPPIKKITRRFGLSVHPDPNERQRLLVDTNQLFSGLGFWDAFATGMAVTIAVPNVVLFLSLVLPFNQAILTTILPALLTAPLVIGSLGMGVWRSSFTSLWGNKNPHDFGRLGIGLGLGLILGYMLSLDTATMQSLVPESSSLGFYAAVGFVALPVILICILFFRWMAASASVWLESVTTSRLLSQVSAPGYVVAGIIFAASLAVFFTSLELVPAISGMRDAFLALISLPVVVFRSWVPVLPFIIIYPLAAGFWRKQQAKTDMQWAFLDTLPEQPAFPMQTPLRPRPASIIGLIGGVVFCGLLLLTRIVLRITFTEDLRNTAEFLLYLHSGSIALAALLQLGVAVIAAIWIRQLGWVHGLFAALIAGCVMTVGILGFNLLFGGTISTAFVWNTFSLVINSGILLALPFVLAISALSGWLGTFPGKAPLKI